MADAEFQNELDAGKSELTGNVKPIQDVIAEGQELPTTVPFVPDICSGRLDAVAPL
ncbi:MAG: hypothetical protein ACC645_12535 [Pirellulales bacterium]